MDRIAKSRKPPAFVVGHLGLAAGVLWWAIGTAFADAPTIAEYRAAPHPAPPLESQTPPPIPIALGESSLLRSITRQTYAISSGLEYRFRETLWGDRRFDTFTVLTVAPLLDPEPLTTTHLYQGVTRDDVSGVGYRYQPEKAADVWRTGLAQIWNLPAWQAQILLGYEFEQGPSSEFSDGLKGHSLNLRGNMPLWWGFEANLEAGVSRQIYPEYGGAWELASDRRSIRAGVSRSFTEQLKADFLFMYADEAFEESPLSYRSHTWGLNLRYDY
ncbi:MAG: hypothetical protein OEQ18_00785 [Gammaproteobacteria bacterium]|nr:hypothetical protein [Gammaproteobacteria bacterium]